MSIKELTVDIAEELIDEAFDKMKHWVCLENILMEQMKKYGYTCNKENFTMILKYLDYPDSNSE